MLGIQNLTLHRFSFIIGNKDYHEKELYDLDPHLYLRQPRHPSAAQMKDILWKLATKQLKPGDWKKLGLYWKFTAEHIRSIEHQYTGIYPQKP